MQSQTEHGFGEVTLQNNGLLIIVNKSHIFHEKIKEGFASFIFKVDICQ